MKKLINMLLCIILMISLVSCNPFEGTFTKETAKMQNSKGRDASGNNVKVDLGQAFNIDINGDLDKDGSYLDNGDYFLYKLKVEPVKKYEYIVITAKIQNNKTKSIKVFKAGWQATLNDGTELSDIKIKDMGEWEEISTGEALNISILIPVEKKLNITKVNLKYDDKNYADLNSNLVKGNKKNIDVKDGIGSMEFNDIEIGN